MRNTFAETLSNFAAEDKSLILLTGDLGYSVLERFQERFPQQFFNLGIAEQSMMSIAAGLAQDGKRPFVYSIANFPTLRCLEQIRNDICAMRAPATIVSVGSGFAYGTAGYSHYLIEDLSAMLAFQIDIYSPACPSEVSLSLEKIIAKERPAYLRIGRGGEVNLNSTNGFISGIREIEKDLELEYVILYHGAIATEVMTALDKLKNMGRRGVAFSCYDFSEIAGIGSKLNPSLPIVTVEEHVLTGGFGSFVRDSLPQSSKFLNIGIKKIDYSLVGSQDFLRKAYGLDAKSLFDSIINFINQ